MRDNRTDKVDTLKNIFGGREKKEKKETFLYNHHTRTKHGSAHCERSSKAKCRCDLWWMHLKSRKCAPETLAVMDAAAHKSEFNGTSDLDTSVHCFALSIFLCLTLSHTLSQTQRVYMRVPTRTVAQPDIPLKTRAIPSAAQMSDAWPGHK